jgi:hypothetical protein
LPVVAEKIDESISMVMSILSVVTNLLISWFGFAYSVTLYKQAKRDLDQAPLPSLTWFGIISGIGWAMAVLGIAISVFALGAYVKSGEWKKHNPLKDLERKMELFESDFNEGDFYNDWQYEDEPMMESDMDPFDYPQNMPPAY